MARLPPPSQVVRFGIFEVDRQTGEIYKSGRKTRLQEQPFQVLTALLERPGEVLTREELKSRLWPADTFVDFDKGLNTSINKIREALGDSAENPRFVETLPRRGYRFIAPVDRVGDGKLGQESAARRVQTERASPGDVKRRSKGGLVWATALIAVLAAVALLLWSAGGDYRSPESPLKAPIESLAVLPLANVSGDPEQEYLSDGMTNTLIRELTRIGALRVTSRTSVMRYKESDKSLGEIARELEVDAAVEGSVLQVGDRIRVTVQLVHAETDTNLWGESYERDMRDVLALQGQVARAIAEAVRVKLAPQEEARLITAREVDPEVWQAYLRGRYVLYNKWDVEKSISYFEQALEKDPDYAPAHAGLGDAYLYSGWRFADPRLAITKARAAAQKAVELDDRLAEAHGLLATLHLYNWDWSAGEREYKRAIELEPNRVMAGYGHFLGLVGRHDEAQAELERVQQLEPLSLITDQYVGMQYVFESRYEEAIRQFRGILEMEPTSANSDFWLGNAYVRQGEYQEAIRAFQRSRAVPKFSERAKAYIAYAHALAGNRAEALRTLDELKARSKERYVPPYLKALICAGLGDRDQAFQWLERAYDGHDVSMVYLKVSPISDSLRGDPRFQDFLKRMNFPE